MLLQSPDLLPLDPGDLPVSIHVSVHQQRIRGVFTDRQSQSLLLASPVHVEHGGELQLVVDLLRPSQSLVELEPRQFKGQDGGELREPVLKDIQMSSFQMLDVALWFLQCFKSDEDMGTCTSLQAFEGEQKPVEKMMRRRKRRSTAPNSKFSFLQMMTTQTALLHLLIQLKG